jgi:hypothetical protein
MKRINAKKFSFILQNLKRWAVLTFKIYPGLGAGFKRPAKIEFLSDSTSD